MRLYQLNRLMEVWTEVIKIFWNYHKVLNSGFPAYMSTFASIAMLLEVCYVLLKCFFNLLFLQEQLPQLWKHFSDKGVESHMFASQWFLTLFTARFPLYFVFHIIDVFLLQGVDTLFQVALALIIVSLWFYWNIGVLKDKLCWIRLVYDTHKGPVERKV
jgi:hypothetical protein